MHVPGVQLSWCTSGDLQTVYIRGGDTTGVYREAYREGYPTQDLSFCHFRLKTPPRTSLSARFRLKTSLRTSLSARFRLKTSLRTPPLSAQNGEKYPPRGLLFLLKTGEIPTRKSHSGHKTGLNPHPGRAILGIKTGNKPTRENHSGHKTGGNPPRGYKTTVRGKPRGYKTTVRSTPGRYKTTVRSTPGGAKTGKRSRNVQKVRFRTEGELLPNSETGERAAKKAPFSPITVINVHKRDTYSTDQQ